MSETTQKHDVLRLENIEIKLEGKTLVALDEHVAPGEILVIMGPSGCGKSTLLALIGGFLDKAFKASGEVHLGDKNIGKMRAEQRRVGILFQDPLLFPHMSVGENLMFGLPAQLKGALLRKTKVEQALKQAGLEGFYERDPATLSGGQKARVALMRVLLADPKALLLDEPFSKLDTELRASIREFVLGEAKRLQLPVVLVTHDEADAKAASEMAHAKLYQLTR